MVGMTNTTFIALLILHLSDLLASTPPLLLSLLSIRSYIKVLVLLVLVLLLY